LYDKNKNHLRVENRTIEENRIIEEKSFLSVYNILKFNLHNYFELAKALVKKIFANND